MDLFSSFDAPLDGGILKGNNALIAYFSDALENERLPHAHILEGPSGSGRHTLTYAVAAALARKTMSDQGMIARIEARQSPDVIEYGLVGTSRSIGIDTVRAIKEASVIVPSELEFKMFIISDAHLLTTQAQNGLLKLLEEPPRAVYFMLLCENTANLLTTVRSRAPTMRMQTFSEDELDELLSGEKKIADIKKRSYDAYRSAIRSAGGSYGAALKTLTSRQKKSADEDGGIRELLTLLRAMPSQVMMFAVKLPSKRDELYDFMDDSRLAFRDLIAVKRASEPTLLWYTDIEKAREDAENFTAKELFFFSETTSEMMQLLDRNVNVGGAQVRWLQRLAVRR